MIKITIIMALSLLLAYQSEMRTRTLRNYGSHYRFREDPAFIFLVVFLCLVSGLRVSYNDTQNYLGIYTRFPGLGEFFSSVKNLNPLKNPLFYTYIGILKALGFSGQFFLFLTSVFCETALLLFFKRYSRHFTFTIFLFFTLGTFCVTIAAIKQVIAMSIMTLAFPYLEKRKWPIYLFFVFFATLFHTYALTFAALPFFIQRPWKFFTYLLAAIVFFLMMNFEEYISGLLDQASLMGKEIADYEVFDNISVNIFRLGVYAVPPVISFVFRRWIFHDSSSMDHILVHMSIISLSFMILGTNSGANMFGRMGNYFELGTLVFLPEMLDRTFNKRSNYLISGIAIFCFLLFFIYANGIHSSFDADYAMVDLVKIMLK